MVLAVAAIWAYRRSQREQFEKTEEPLQGGAVVPDPSPESEQRWQNQLPNLDSVRDNLLRCYSSPDMSDLEGAKLPQVPASTSSVEPPSMINEQQHSGELDSTFRSVVRDEWINAVFGKEFFATPDYEAPRHGAGLSQIHSYVTYTINIPTDTSDANEDGVDRFGVTISRMAIGLYVRKVHPGSEAFLAGVTENSILVSINGMAMLAEPAKQALERMWQYEGYAVGDDIAEGDKPSGSGTSDANIPFRTTTPAIKEPVTLTFMRDGRMYSVLFLSNPPYGITWGPCGNFALVQRVYSHAEAAGVRRGSLVAAVNGISLRTLDHKEAAETLRDLYSARRDIQMVLCYTPSAARTGYFEGKSKAAAQHPKPKVAAVNDGVEVRVHPLEHSIASLWSRPPANPQRTSRHLFPGDVVGKGGNLGELASRVAAGEELVPTGRGCWIPLRVYGHCPPLPKETLLSRWDLLSALRYCISLHNADYIESNVDPDDCNKHLAELIEETNSDDRVVATVGMFLPQLISAICIENSPETSEEKKEHNSADELDEMKELVDQLTSCLLRSSRRDENLGQSLHFLLRCYIATFETYRTAAGERGTARNLLALMHCLDLLRSAEKQLVDQMSISAVCSNGNATMSSQLSTERTEESAFDDVPAPTAGVLVSNKKDFKTRRGINEEASPKKSKSVMGLFRKKPSKQDICKQPQAPRVLIANDIGGSPSEMEPTKGPRLDNMTSFLDELDTICETIADSLLKSFSQKIADWAFQPWSESKGNALTKVTEVMRIALSKSNNDPPRLPLVNPIDSSEVLTSVDSKECYILPSAHFPLLLAFNVDATPTKSEIHSANRHSGISVISDEKLYRTRVEIVALRGSPRQNGKATSTTDDRSSFVIHGAVAGTVKESDRSTMSEKNRRTHVWDEGNLLTFDTRSCWGAPQTLSLKLSSVTVSDAGHDQVSYSDDSGRLQHASEVGYCWIDLRPVWNRAVFNQETTIPRHATVTCHAQVWSLDTSTAFDDNGEMTDVPLVVAERLEIELRVTAELLPFTEQSIGGHCPKRLLLYKHDDDLRQEMFAIQFITACDNLLKASGLDLKLLTFRCIPVGPRRGFIEWIPGSVPLSDICQPFAGWLLDDNGDQHVNDDASLQSVSGVAKAGFTKYKSLRRLGGNQQTEPRGSFANNPIQDYLRSVAYDPEGPYLIQNDVMGNYIKSCAGYCVITYLLGVGDRHLDNLLLHHTGRFFHCDYSFILGNDPKKYLPVRITEDMIFGMGGRDSDNYAKFLSLTGATFLALRQPGNVRFLLSLVRSMVPSGLPDLTSAPEDVILGIRGRLRLDLSERAAVSFMEKLIETSLSSKMWLAVDAIHSLGKKF